MTNNDLFDTRNDQQMNNNSFTMTDNDTWPMEGLPAKQGLYDPSLEKDACGVGLVVNVKRQDSHKMVQDGIEMLERLEHRGACGCDPDTGDGAGMLLATPHGFFRRVLKTNFDIDLPQPGRYAAGLLFLPREEDARLQAKAFIDSVVIKYGQKILCWRAVPTNNKKLGQGALKSEPHMEQVFIEAHPKLSNRDFDCLMFLIRRTIFAQWKGPGRVYVCSLHPNTIVYKGQLTPRQLGSYFLDLQQPDFTSYLVMVHSRFSTNTFPNWERAQPLRCVAHNGEINTLKGNRNSMHSRQGILKSPILGDLSSIFPICDPSTSDSGSFDNVLELLMYAGGRSIEHAMLMLIPEPWQNNTEMEQWKRDFYEYHSCLMEAWDGPALMVFTDGNKVGACLDRNGLRPARYYVTHQDQVILASEVGALPSIDPATIQSKGCLKAGNIFLVDTSLQRIVSNQEIKHALSTSTPYSTWLQKYKLPLPGILEQMKQLSKNDLLKPENTAQLLDLTTFSRFSANTTTTSDSTVIATKTTPIQRLIAFGYSSETIRMLLSGMCGANAEEGLGSMGNDSALACLSKLPRSLFDYFSQLFAQVTNPPIDPIREDIVMSLACPIGPEHNLLTQTPQHCSRILLQGPVLTPAEFRALTNIPRPGWQPAYIDITFPRDDGLEGLERAIKRICAESVVSIMKGAKLIVLCDTAVSYDRVGISSLLAVGAVHQHLIGQSLRHQVGLIVQAGDIHEVHHHCLLVGFGVDAIYPYVAYEACQKYEKEESGKVEIQQQSLHQLIYNYQKASHKGIFKVMAKMGISTLQSYKGAQIFEALGLSSEIMNLCFTSCPSRLSGITFTHIAKDLMTLHQQAFPINTLSSINPSIPSEMSGSMSGVYHWRSLGNAEAHLNHPDTIMYLQEAARTNSRDAYAQYSNLINQLNQQCTLRGQLDLKLPNSSSFSTFSQLQRTITSNASKSGISSNPTSSFSSYYNGQGSIPLESVEPAKDIVKRFVTGAMSYGSISLETHTTLAMAMNKMGGKSNSGEGGEHETRYAAPGANGVDTRSSIKQVASARFGVTIYYLTNANEIQIKMAQGAKPGEGGELPGHKVSEDIAKTRHSTPGVGLISPPPHHDIYSIEDLAQLISDLRHANPNARISVKLVSEVGIGIVAAGVAKAKADHILISGHDGGTGASKWTAIKHAGLPWELGLAETHQTLTLNGLRSRVTLQTDGQLKNGMDVVKAALLGAEEFCFATAPLIALGCIMMRKCHLNTCPVGIATQDPELRAKFTGQPEHLINYFFLVAEEVREIMASLGLYKFNDLIGRADLLQVAETTNEKVKSLDLRCMLLPAWQINPLPVSSYASSSNSNDNQKDVNETSPPNNNHPSLALIKREPQQTDLLTTLDARLLQLLSNKIEQATPVRIELPISNTDLTVGTLLSHYIAKQYGQQGLPYHSIHLKLRGYGGQSLGAWLAKGILLELEGDANDYVGKGLSGGTIILYPSKNATFHSHENVIAGNVCLYGATSGFAFIRGRGCQRFAVRNSGAYAVIEGCGDHGCEYMTAGVVVILGKTGRNFAAGMSGGIAYVYDADSNFKKKVNMDMVNLEKVESGEDVLLLRRMIECHLTYTNSPLAKDMIAQWPKTLQRFVKVMPHDFKQVLLSNRAANKEVKLIPDFLLDVPSTPQYSVAQNLVTSLQPTLTPNKAAAPVPISISSASNTTGGCDDCSCTSADSSNTTSSSCASSTTIPVPNIHNTDKLSQLLSNPAITSRPTKDIEDVIGKRASTISPNLTAAADGVVAISKPTRVAKPDKVQGFIKYSRAGVRYRPALERVADWSDIVTNTDAEELKTQASRCMDCGTPFCHQQTHGCPLGNKIPEWNDLVYRGLWKSAFQHLMSTNNFPEFTGRVCPAPCEGSCVLGIIAPAVTIKNIENSIIDEAYKQGWMMATPASVRSGKRVAVIGSGPAGLAVADQLNKVGHFVTVYERSDRIGGLLTYGIPNMKLDKTDVVERRVNIMKAEGVEFRTGVEIGQQMTLRHLRQHYEYDAIVLATGSSKARDLPVSGRNLQGVVNAMDYLTGVTKSLLDSNFMNNRFINATNKHVVIIGGGDTGTDCIATATRQKAASITNLEIMSKPPVTRANGNPWPTWPLILRTEYGHSEASAVYGKDPRQFAVLTKRIVDDGQGNVCGVEITQVEWVDEANNQQSGRKRKKLKEIEGSTRIIPANLVILALGFTGAEAAVANGTNVEFDVQGNIKAQYESFLTNSSVDGAAVFACGDCRRGQSLVVWAIAEGRKCARQVDQYLMGTTSLP